MTWGRVVVVAALVALVLYCRGPSASSIVSETTLSPDEGWLEYREARFEAEWGPRITREGRTRFFERAKYKSAPFFTHHTVLTTGEFSDPELVSIRKTGGGSFSWAAPRKPKGTLVVLHMVPLDEDVLDQLQAIDDGDRVELVGREEVDGGVTGSDGSGMRLGSRNHKLFLVERATPLPD